MTINAGHMGKHYSSLLDSPEWICRGLSIVTLWGSWIDVLNIGIVGLTIANLAVEHIISRSSGAFVVVGVEAIVGSPLDGYLSLRAEAKLRI